MIELEDLLLGDVLLQIIVLSNFIIILIAYRLYSKTRRQITGTLGLCIYFIGFAFFNYISDIFMRSSAIIYPVMIFASFLFVICGIIFIYLVERDMKKIGTPFAKVSLYSTIYALITGSIVIFFLISGGLNGVLMSVPFMGLAVAWLYTGLKYVKSMSTMELVHRHNPKFWFMFGFALTGFSLFLFSFAEFYPLLILMKDALILIGSISIAHSWKYLPKVNELDWMLVIRRIIVIEKTTSLSIYDFIFQTKTSEEKTEKAIETLEDPTDSNLIAGALSGFNILVGEILSSSGGLAEITYSNYKIIFHRRSNFICLLISEESREEHRFRLETFGINFEKKFLNDVINFDGEINVFKNADELIQEIFT